MSNNRSISVLNYWFLKENTTQQGIDGRSRAITCSLEFESCENRMHSAIL